MSHYDRRQAFLAQRQQPLPSAAPVAEAYYPDVMDQTAWDVAMIRNIAEIQFYHELQARLDPYRRGV
jgi:hypothetical protein